MKGYVVYPLTVNKFPVDKMNKMADFSSLTLKPATVLKNIDQ